MQRATAAAHLYTKLPLESSIQRLGCRYYRGWYSRLCGRPQQNLTLSSMPTTRTTVIKSIVKTIDSAARLPNFCTCGRWAESPPASSPNRLDAPFTRARQAYWPMRHAHRHRLTGADLLVLELALIPTIARPALTVTVIETTARAGARGGSAAGTLAIAQPAEVACEARAMPPFQQLVPTRNKGS